MVLGGGIEWDLVLMETGIHWGNVRFRVSRTKSPEAHELGTVTHAHHPSTMEMEAQGSEVPVRREFKASLQATCLKKTNKRKLTAAVCH